MIVNSSKNKIFPLYFDKRDFEDEDKDEDGDDDEFYTPEETPRDIMPDLETEESVAQRRKHEGHGLKILTP